MRKDVHPASDWREEEIGSPGNISPLPNPPPPRALLRLCASGGRRGFWVGGSAPPLGWRPFRVLLQRRCSKDGCSGCKQGWIGTRQWPSGQLGHRRGEGGWPSVLCSPPLACLGFIPEMGLQRRGPGCCGRDARPLGPSWLHKPGPRLRDWSSVLASPLPGIT